MSVRAKFRCVSDELTIGHPDPQHKYVFRPVYEPDVPEDRRYAKSTPSGEAWLLVTNPAVTFEVGEHYYLDFTPVIASE